MSRAGGSGRGPAPSGRSKSASERPPPRHPAGTCLTWSRPSGRSRLVRRGDGRVSAEGRGSADDNSVIGRYLRDQPDAWSSDEAFRAFAEEVRAQRLEAMPRPVGFVPDTELWWIDGDEFVGRVGIRHRLTPALLEMGGHIGYDVRPSARRRGHATEMLRQALGVARELGIDPTLVTCDVDNVGSRAVIERNGGVLEDERAGKLRFWVQTH